MESILKQPCHVQQYSLHTTQHEQLTYLINFYYSHLFRKVLREIHEVLRQISRSASRISRSASPNFAKRFANFTKRFAKFTKRFANFHARNFTKRFAEYKNFQFVQLCWYGYAFSKLKYYSNMDIIFCQLE